jgi:hypothetical protein
MKKFRNPREALTKFIANTKYAGLIGTLIKSLIDR